MPHRVSCRVSHRMSNMGVTQECHIRRVSQNATQGVMQGVTQESPTGCHTRDVTQGVTQNVTQWCRSHQTGYTVQHSSDT